jgi:hypothetical protein
MGYQSTDHPGFQGTAARWLAEHSEILAMIRYSRAGGAKSFEFFQSVDSFRNRINALSPATCVILFRDRQLPLRGRVDDDFISRACAVVPDGGEFLIVGLERVVYGVAEWFPDAAGETHAELREALQEMRGQAVAVGMYPPWLEDNDSVVSAVVPNPDGSVETGVY